jgi:hypothetical protein
MRQRLIAGRREIINPRELKNPGIERPGDFDGPVRAARVNNHDLIKEAAHRLETVR